MNTNMNTNTSTNTNTNTNMSIAELETKTKEELMEMAKEKGVATPATLKKHDIIMLLLETHTEAQGNIFCSGILEIMADGYGFLRQETLLPSQTDVYISPSQIRRFSLRNGDMVSGQGRPPKSNEKYFSLLQVVAINNLDPELAKSRQPFGSLTPTFPDRLINLEHSPTDLSTRLINLIAPIGRGQRGLIVSPPKAGKTLLLKSIANSISTTYEDIHLMVCLIGERPEEVTDMRRSVKGEVIAATFDEMVENQTRVAELALERAKRLVESGKDVVILLDGITRLTRAYNLAMPSSGRTLSAESTPPPCTRPNVSSAPPGIPPRAAALPLSPPALSIPAAAWTTSSMKSLRGPATWSFTSTGGFPNAEFSRPWISSVAAPGGRSFYSARRPRSRYGCCGAWWG